MGRGGNQRAPSCANVLANTNLDALVSHSTRELCRLWGRGEHIGWWVKHLIHTLHAGELLGRVDVEGGRVDRLAMPDRGSGNDLNI